MLPWSYPLGRSGHVLQVWTCFAGLDMRFPDMKVMLLVSLIIYCEIVRFSIFFRFYKAKTGRILPDPPFWSDPLHQALSLIG